MNRLIGMFSKLLPWMLGTYILLMFGFTLSAVAELSYYEDELIHLEKIQVFLDHGVYARSGGENAAGELLGTRGYLYTYGPIFTLFAHLVTVLVGVEAWGTIEYTDAAFVVRHIMVSVFSFVAVVVAGWAVAIVTQSLRWGLAASAILVSIPLWTGSAMFNLKDTPAATGYTMLTAGCIALTLPVDRLTRGIRFAGWLSMFGGTLIIWGVRPGLWPAIALACFGMLLVRARFNNFSRWKESFSALIFPLSAVVASYAAMMAIYPKNFLNAFNLLYKSFSETSNFPHHTFVQTNGVFLEVPPPRYYIPQWLAAQLPEVLLVLLVVAIVVAAWLVLHRLFRSTSSTLDIVFPAMVYVFIQVAAFPAAAIILKSAVYDGLRQFLFLLPGIAMLITLALFVLVRHAGLRKIRGLWPAVAGLLVASTILTTSIQVQLFPYMVSYFNPITVSGGIDGRWDMYSRRLAVGELYAKISLEQRQRCTNCPPIDKFPSRYAAPSTVDSEPLQYWESVRFFHFVPKKPRAKGSPPVADSVSRPYFGATITMLYFQLCDIKAPPVEKNPTSAAGDATWLKKISEWGWDDTRSNVRTSSPGLPSALAWSMEPIAAGATRSFVLDLSVRDGSADFVTLSVMVNGIALDDFVMAAQGRTDLVIDVPAPSIEGAPDDLVVVEFVLTDGNRNPVTNSLVVTSIRPAV